MRFSSGGLRLLAWIQLTRTAQDSPPESYLTDAITGNPRDCESRYRLSAVKALQGEHEEAMNQLLEIVKCDRSFRDDAGRKGLLALFDLLGPGDPLVSRFRGLMATALH